MAIVMEDGTNLAAGLDDNKSLLSVKDKKQPKERERKKEINLFIS